VSAPSAYGWASSAPGEDPRGIKPNLSIELTRECPLRCPGCYAYSDQHLEGDVTLRSLADFKGGDLVARVRALVERHDPLHISIIGGEPLVRYRELGEILPWLAARGVYTNLVTSAVRPIPLEWAGLDRLLIAVSVDGLQPEHDARRTPATYDRILKHIAGHQVTVHCTVTRQQTQRPDTSRSSCDSGSAQAATRRIWFSLYTPQAGEVSDERLSEEDRKRVAAEILASDRGIPSSKRRSAWCWKASWSRPNRQATASSRARRIACLPTCRPSSRHANWAGRRSARSAGVWRRRR